MGCICSKPAVAGEEIINVARLIEAQRPYWEQRRSLDRPTVIVDDSKSSDASGNVPNILTRELKKEILKDPCLCKLVKGFLEKSFKVDRSFASLKDCSHESRRNQAILRGDALELLFTKKGRSTVMEKLNSRDPFTGSFIDEFGSVCEQQKSMLDMLNLQKVEIDGKLSSVKAWRKAWDFIYRTAFAAVLIGSVVLAAVVVPHVATAAATSVATAMGSVERWINSFWDGHEAELGLHKDLISKMRDATFSSVHDLDTIRILVEHLKILIGQHGEEEAMFEDVMEIIKNKLGEYAKGLEEMEKVVDKCGNDLKGAVTLILGTITA